VTKAWLKDVDWNLIVDINRELCAPKKALHKATSDGHEETKRLWEEGHAKKMGLDEAVELCRRCHRLAPFCNYNGNTFVAVIRNIINGARELTSEEKAVARSLAGHLVAGTAQLGEEDQFRALLDRLNSRIKP
jgi:hypothetical protein